MINFPGIPNATVYGHAKGASKTPPQRPVKTTIYEHTTGVKATVYGHTKGAPKMPPQHPVNATVYMSNFTNEKINTYQ